MTFNYKPEYNESEQEDWSKNKPPPKKINEGYISKTFRAVSRSEDKIRPNGKKRPVWNCECILCGETMQIESQSLASSCHRDCICITSKITKEDRWRGGLTSKYPKEACSYYHMVGRCNNPKEAGYENYGGRGIKVCDFWLESFDNFFSEMGEKPHRHVLDRIDPNGDYCKENCRWVDRNLSAFNTRKHVTNTSGRTGVYWFKRVNKWTAAIIFKKKQIHLGYFENFDDAVAAREAAEIKYFGELKHK
jgi:hypothetical protein